MHTGARRCLCTAASVMPRLQSSAPKHPRTSRSTSVSACSVTLCLRMSPLSCRQQAEGPPPLPTGSRHHPRLQQRPHLARRLHSPQNRSCTRHMGTLTRQLLQSLIASRKGWLLDAWPAYISKAPSGSTGGGNGPTIDYRTATQPLIGLQVLGVQCCGLHDVHRPANASDGIPQGCQCSHCLDIADMLHMPCLQQQIGECQARFSYPQRGSRQQQQQQQPQRHACAFGRGTCSKEFPNLGPLQCQQRDGSHGFP